MSETERGQATSAIRNADVLIVGGGLSGTMLAVQLLRLPGKRQILVIEPRQELGRGEAYSAVELGHTLNGNAARMSVDPDNADDLTQWLTAYIADGGWPESDQQHVPISELFPPRGIFGLYAQQRLAEAKALSASTVEHVRAEVVDLEVDEHSTLLTLSDGQQLRGTFAVLATGMFPAARTPQTESSGLNAAAVDPWDVQAMTQLDPQSTVLIIGSGLTMVDAVVSLEQAGHRGPVEIFRATACCPTCAGSHRPGSTFWGKTTACAVLGNCCGKYAANASWRWSRGSTGKRRWTPCAPISGVCGARPARPRNASSCGIFGPGGKAITTARRP